MSPRNLLPTGCALLLATCCAGRAQTNIAPKADEVLQAASRYLATAPEFSINAEVWQEHVNDLGEKLQFSREVQLEVKRPNRLHVRIYSPHVDREFWYDGKALTILDGRHNVYSTAPMPGTLDAALDTARSEFGVDLPLIDLVVSDPYKSATARVSTGLYFGLSPAMGFSCHHLAFIQDNIDWQSWVQAGPYPYIRKFVITYKNEPGSPEFTALIKQWDMTDRISDSDFVFEPPRGALKVPMKKEGAPAAMAPTGRTPEPLTSPKAKEDNP